MQELGSNAQASSINTFGGRVQLMETCIQQHTDELVQTDQRIVSIQSDVALIKQHLRDEHEARQQRQNVAMAVEQRITELELKIRMTQLVEQRVAQLEQMARGAIPGPAP